jgi:hypothetical protein
MDDAEGSPLYSVDPIPTALIIVQVDEQRRTLHYEPPLPTATRVVVIKLWFIRLPNHISLFTYPLIRQTCFLVHQRLGNRECVRKTT